MARGSVLLKTALTTERVGSRRVTETITRLRKWAEVSVCDTLPLVLLFNKAYLPWEKEGAIHENDSSGKLNLRSWMWT